MQFGVEIFSESISKQQDSMKELLDYIQTSLNQKLSVAVISHYSLLKKLLTKDELEDPDIKHLLRERNLDGLIHQLGTEHPVVQLMSQPVPDQLHFAKAKFPDLKESVNEIIEWSAILEKKNIPTVYSDLFSLPAQSYYKGIFLQFYTDQLVEPIVTGGQYSSPTKAFGMAINLTDLTY